MKRRRFFSLGAPLPRGVSFDHHPLTRYGVQLALSPGSLEKEDLDMMDMLK